MNYTTNTDINVALLDSLYKDSSLTLEGLDLSSLDAYANYLNDVCGLKDNAVFHIISGEVMNDVYDLYGDNAYPDDLHIVCIKLECLKKPMAIVTKRFEFGGRWFDDVVDNNVGLHSKSRLG